MKEWSRLPPARSLENPKCDRRQGAEPLPSTAPSGTPWSTRLAKPFIALKLHLGPSPLHGSPVLSSLAGMPPLHLAASHILQDAFSHQCLKKGVSESAPPGATSEAPLLDCTHTTHPHSMNPLRNPVYSLLYPCHAAACISSSPPSLQAS